MAHVGAGGVTLFWPTSAGSLFCGAVGFSLFVCLYVWEVEAGPRQGEAMEETTLIQAYQESVHSLYEYVSRRCGGDRSLAEDVTQETWLRAVKAWKKSGLPDHPLAWLKTVARNLIINYHRRAPMISLEALPSDWERRFLEDGSDGGSSDHAAALNWCLARMRPNQARLLEAFHLQGLKVSEIAAQTGLGERAVEGRLRRARIKLRKNLESLVRSGGGPS